ncbi:MAG: GHKL domain-containing protein [Eubacteriales bacterium]|nr:GHKL domain-containing protein [Eubacteriales bacterium]
MKAQEGIILQQQTHLALLEELQQEMRSFRHDFANLMAGVTIQARDGDLRGIQDFMRNTSSYFDERLGDEIKNLEAVSRINIPSLRSLITSKMAQIQRAGVQIDVEILYPVISEGIRQQDLLRSLGILLDNALEAAKLSEHPRISLVLLQTDTELLAAVANSYASPPDLVEMSRDNYTTKGKDHGTGLMSLRKIIHKYPGCVTGMNLKDNMFRYEIRIPL